MEKILAQTDFYDALDACHWRGNIRELRNTIECAVLLGLESEQLTIDHLPEQLHDAWFSLKLRKQPSAAASSNSESGLSVLKICTRHMRKWVCLPTPTAVS